MVKVVEDLEQFKRNVEHCRIIYKVDEVGTINQPYQYRVRIQGGSPAWDGTEDSKVLKSKLERLQRSVLLQCTMFYHIPSLFYVLHIFSVFL